MLGAWRASKIGGCRCGSRNEAEAAGWVRHPSWSLERCLWKCVGVHPTLRLHRHICSAHGGYHPQMPLGNELIKAVTAEIPRRALLALLARAGARLPVWTKDSATAPSEQVREAMERAAEGDELLLASLDGQATLRSLQNQLPASEPPMYTQPALAEAWSKIFVAAKLLLQPFERHQAVNAVGAVITAIIRVASFGTTSSQMAQQRHTLLSTMIYDAALARALAKSEGWVDDTPVSVSTFGALVFDSPLSNESILGGMVRAHSPLKSTDSELVVEVEAPADSSAQEISNAVADLAQAADKLHRSMGGGGLLVSAVEVEAPVDSFVGDPA